MATVNVDIIPANTLGDTLPAETTNRNRLDTPTLIIAMLSVGKGISDLIFSPGRPPQVERHGELTAIPSLPVLQADDTAAIARDLVGKNDHALKTLKEQGACDLSYSLPEHARFRVNIFRQRGTFAIVMRVIATKIPTLADLEPAVLARRDRRLQERHRAGDRPDRLGQVVDAGRADRRHQREPRRAHHHHRGPGGVPAHRTRRATIHQRELHSDTPTFALALRAALRQAPKVILVGEMRDRETIEIALTAAETGHLVFSTCTPSTRRRRSSASSAHSRRPISTGCGRGFAASFRAIVSQRLVPRKGGGRIAVLEILKSTMRTREYIEKGEGEGRSLVDAMRDGSLDGMQSFDGELERLAREGTISVQTALLYASNLGDLRLTLGDLEE